jgi:5-methyltetrahydrofolate--homocysteine methyltransferase
MQLIRRLHGELKVNTTRGASNVSFGLPNRRGLNAAFLSMAMGAGLTSAITNPLEAELLQAIRGADVLLDHDPQCRRWIEAYREPAEAGTQSRRSGRRRRPGGDPPGAA